MATDAKNHTVPASTDAPSRSELLSLSLSIRDVIYAATATARDNIVSALSSAGVAVSASNPIYVHRADKAAGQELEYSTDGTNWYTINASLTSNRFFKNDSLSGTTDASGFIVINHGAPFTPTSVFCVNKNPGSSFAQFYGADTFTATTTRTRWMNANAGGMFVSSAIGPFTAYCYA